MTENTNIIVQAQEDGRGRIEIAPEVLEIILGIAASQIDGVYEMRGTLTNNINELFGRVNRGKGVTIKISDGRLIVDIYAYLNYGVSVPKVAVALQQALKEQLLYMTDLKVDEINIHVVGLIPEKEAQKLDPSTLFNDNDDEAEDTAADATLTEDGAQD
ncbi:Asp23/Gls24 family envelope stress response protein [Agrilactobacillus yilanensis]|uniref:Asp23/Gls24 family envelope stress response protein n=1 Tax=Agrilactobacillus yilanensis TaxID=2485997 RepID=A0ABW4J8V7_9LACO|nr:Asp23/Gls24 family envelope stress response protein [Agrilactobacillus yilanensis]